MPWWEEEEEDLEGYKYRKCSRHINDSYGHNYRHRYRNRNLIHNHNQCIFNCSSDASCNSHDYNPGCRHNDRCHRCRCKHHNRRCRHRRGWGWKWKWKQKPTPILSYQSRTVQRSRTSATACQTRRAAQLSLKVGEKKTMIKGLGGAKGGSKVKVKAQWVQEGVVVLVLVMELWARAGRTRNRPDLILVPGRGVNVAGHCRDRPIQHRRRHRSAEERRRQQWQTAGVRCRPRMRRIVTRPWRF